jgi:spermidine/putrescine transport system permease protein
MTALRRPARLRKGMHPGLAAPAVAFIGVFLGLPLLLVLVYSFLSRGPYGVGIRWEPTTEAYRQFLFDRAVDGSLTLNTAYLSIFGSSVLLAAATTVLCLLLGVPMAMWIATRPPHRRNQLVLLVTIPFWTNMLVRTYAWILLLKNDGLINRGLLGLGVVEAPLALLYNHLATGIGLLYSFLPFLVLPVYASMEKFDFRQAEAAFDLGADKPTVLRRIVWPAIRPGVLAGATLVFVPALGAFIQPVLLGGGRSLMIGSLIQLQFGASRNWPFGSALAFVLLAIVLLVLLAFVRVSRRTGRVESLL